MSAAPTIEDAARERFERDTAAHEMTVIHDDGLYRHLRFADRNPERAWCYWYDIVTWPGRLVICGDVGDYMFSRLSDMFDFFGGKGDRINPHYWGEKLRGLQHGREGAMSYSEDVFRARVREWLRDTSEDMDDAEAAALAAAVERDVLDDPDGYLGDESFARQRLADFSHDGHDFKDTWEWDLREYDWSYLWCCWAIVRGIEQYRAAASAWLST